MPEIAALVPVVFISCFTPGPNNSMVMQSGLIFGFRRTVPHICGVVGGFFILFQSVRLGLYRVFEFYPQFMFGLKVAGSLYFIYVAWNMFRLRIPDNSAQTASPAAEGLIAGPSRPFRLWSAVLFQWVNVKAWFFAISANASVPSLGVPQIELLVGLVVLCLTTASICTWTLLGQALERLLSLPWCARGVNLILSLSLLYVVYSWW